MTRTSEFIHAALEETVNSYGQPVITVRVIWEMRREEIAQGVVLWDERGAEIEAEYVEVAS